MKKISAIIAATIITAIVGFGMLIVGANAIFNPNSVPVSNTPANSQADPPATVGSAPSGDAQAQIAQLQNLVQQYQGREKQYQSQIAQYQSQVNQLNSQVQQMQGILVQLQRRGIISIQSDGTIQLGRGGFGGGGFGGGSDDDGGGRF